ncbi:protein of unknown function [Clostridium beijerinckii]|nr:protein of unknown function [Clostridium beijerinckii]
MISTMLSYLSLEPEYRFSQSLIGITLNFGYKRGILYREARR